MAQRTVCGTATVKNQVINLTLWHSHSIPSSFLILRSGLLTACFALLQRVSNAFQRFLGCRQVGERLADPPPQLAAMLIDQQRCIQRDVLPASSGGMDQPILADNPRTGIAQHGELAVHDLIPHLSRMLLIIDTDGKQAHAELLELVVVLREPAQLARAIGSPIAAIEDHQRWFSAQRRKLQRLSPLVLECEIGSELTLCGCNLRLGQPLRRRGSSKQQHHQQQPGKATHGLRILPWLTNLGKPVLLSSCHV